MKQADPAGVRCTMVEGKVKGGGDATDALCSHIRDALSAIPAGRGAVVEVRRPKPFVIQASVTTADGRRLPDFNTSVSDSDFTPAMIERFARDLSEHVHRSAPASE